jgi:hypothetical protein
MANQTILSVFFVGALAATVGCAGPESPESEASPQEEETFTLTSISANEDGTRTIVERSITASQQRAMIAERARTLGLAVDEAESPAEGLGVDRSAIHFDSSCPPAALWMFSRINLTGDQVCLIGTGTLDGLTTMGAWECHLPPWENFWKCATYGHGLSSYWAGANPGAFQPYDAVEWWEFEWFNAWQLVNYSGDKPKIAVGLY